MLWLGGAEGLEWENEVAGAEISPGKYTTWESRGDFRIHTVRRDELERKV